MDEVTHGICPHCGHLNELGWRLCDQCGKRLPWAPPEEEKKSIADLSEEQLKVLFAPQRPRQVPFLLTPQGKKIVGAVVTLLSILWWLRGL